VGGFRGGGFRPMGVPHPISSGHVTSSFSRSVSSHPMVARHFGTFGAAQSTVRTRVAAFAHANRGGRWAFAGRFVTRPGPFVWVGNAWVQARNQSAFLVIPALVPGGVPVNTETFIASIDVHSPIEPVAGCSIAPCQWGALSMANDASWGAAWRYDNADAARAAATGNCASRASEPCAATATAVGTAWIAGLNCKKYDAAGTYWRWSVTGLGHDLGGAISNAYRTAVQDGSYNAGQCDFVTAVAADGAQTQFAHQ
jgi:hypothetical protein